MRCKDKRTRRTQKDFIKNHNTVSSTFDLSTKKIGVSSKQKETFPEQTISILKVSR